MKNGEFNYEITTPTGVLKSRPLREGDIGEAVGMLVSVTKSNYKEIFGIGCTGSYTKSGALLETDRGAIERFVREHQYQTCGIWAQDGEMLAWMAGHTGGMQDSYFTCKDDFAFEDGCENAWQDWQNAIQRGTMVSESCMMVKQPARYPHAGLILLTAWSRVLLAMGKTVGVTEVDCVCACTDADATHELNLDNKGSLYNMGFIGHKVVAKRVYDEIRVDEGITVKCISRVFQGTIQEMNSRLHTVMEKIDIHIEAVSDETKEKELCSVTF